MNADRFPVVLIHALTIAAFVLGVLLRAPPLVYAGPVLAVGAAALSYRRAGAPWAQTHHEHALRTLAIGYPVWAIAHALTLINDVLMTVTIYLHIAVALWALIRAGLGLTLAVTRKPIPHPHGLLI